MLHNTGFCQSCQSQASKLDFSVIQATVEAHQMKLLTTAEEYTGNKQLLRLECKCGNPYQAVLSDIRTDKHCTDCKKIKYKETCQEKYGVDNAFQSEEIKTKIRRRNQELWGVDWPMQHAEMVKKAKHTAYSHRDFTFPSGNIVRIQGYEDIALRELLQEGITEDQIKMDEAVPTLDYTAEDGVARKYFADFYLPHLNMLVEVKSTFTLDSDRARNEAKFASIKTSGYTLRLMVYDNQGKHHKPKVLDKMY